MKRIFEKLAFANVFAPPVCGGIHGEDHGICGRLRDGGSGLSDLCRRPGKGKEPDGDADGG